VPPDWEGNDAVFQNVTLVNIYAPSGAERRREREHFFSSDLPYVMRDLPTTMLVGGHFNSVLTNMDATGHLNCSPALQALIQGFDLVDMWDTAQGRDIYTHYTSRGASLINRI
jgi:exonuclease III